MAEQQDRTGMVQVELTQDEWEQRSAKLAEDEQSRFDLIDKKKTHNRKWNEELIQLREGIRQLTEEVNTRKAWVPAQAQMPFGGGGEAANDDDEPAAAEAPARRRGRRGGGRRGNGAAAEAAGADA